MKYVPSKFCVFGKVIKLCKLNRIKLYQTDQSNSSLGVMERAYKKSLTAEMKGKRCRE